MRKQASQTGLNLGIVPLAVAAAAVIGGQIAIATLREREQGGQFESWTTNPLVSVLVVALWVALGYLLITATVRIPALLRNRQLARRFPGHQVLTSGRIPALAVALEHYFRLSGATPPRVPLFFSVVPTKAGIEIWADPETAPVFTLAWSQVGQITAQPVREAARTSNAICIQVTSTAEPIDLPFVVTGRGFGGMYPQRLEDLSKVAERMHALRSEN